MVVIRRADNCSVFESFSRSDSALMGLSLIGFLCPRWAFGTVGCRGTMGIRKQGRDPMGAAVPERFSAEAEQAVINMHRSTAGLDAAVSAMKGTG
ncbi:hypothetical protein GCM10009784_08330 [Arthrobacter parietis]|uniref:Uncharacterized protein n=1 Tax=Arthrobacter parietis TaxID=271434 RepID=A0ABN3AQL7_9MICC